MLWTSALRWTDRMDKLITIGSLQSGSLVILDVNTALNLTLVQGVSVIHRKPTGTPSLKAISLNGVPDSTPSATNPALGEKSTGSIPLQSNATIVANFPTSLSQYGLIYSLIISVSIWIVKYVHTYTYINVHICYC